jgi:uncharacterized protein
MSLDQQNIISRLKKTTAYSHPISRIKLLETHISWILLTGKFVYKIKNLNLVRFLTFQNFH